MQTTGNPTVVVEEDGSGGVSEVQALQQRTTEEASTQEEIKMTEERKEREAGAENPKLMRR